MKSFFDMSQGELAAYQEATQLTRSRTLIQRGGNHYVVSTADTFDMGWETMVFPAREDGTVIDYIDLACRRYADAEAAKAGHLEMVAEFQP